jgi:DNA-binding transcriptional LysR family regulator
VFVCVADVGSFTAAAHILDLTSSTVSKGIAGWKTGSRPVHRTTRRLS